MYLKRMKDRSNAILTCSLLWEPLVMSNAGLHLLTKLPSDLGLECQVTTLNHIYPVLFSDCGAVQ